MLLRYLHMSLDKLSSLRALLRSHGAYALILVDRANMGYAVGYEDGVLVYVDDSLTRVVTPLLDVDRASELVGGGVELIPYAGYRLPIEQRAIWGIDELTKEVSSWLRPGSTILVDNPDSQLVKRILKAVNVNIVDVSDEVRSIRAVKTPGEVDLIKRAISITLRVLEEVYNMPLEGVSERELAAYIYQGLIRYGADEVAFNPIVGSGPNGAKPHHTHSNRVVRRGDSVVIDVGARYRLYCSDMTRTILVGQVDQRIKDALRAVIEASKAAISLIRPGIKASEVDLKAREIIGEYGFGWGFIHSLGHGVGIEVHEKPLLSPTSNDALAAGNVVTVEPGIYIRGVGGVRVENMVLVTDTGAEVLTRDRFSYV